MIEINKFSKEIRTKLKERYDLSKYNDSLYFMERGKDKKKLDKRRISLVLKNTCPYIREDILEKELYTLIENELISKFEYKPFKKKEYYGILEDIKEDVEFKGVFYDNIIIDMGNFKKTTYLRKGSWTLQKLKFYKKEKIPMKSLKLDNGKWVIQIDYKKLKEMFEKKKLFEDLYI